MTIENGCLEMSPYSKHELLNYDEKNMGNLDKNIEDKLKWLPISNTVRRYSDF